MKAILIDATDRTIKPIELPDLKLEVGKEPNDRRTMAAVKEAIGTTIVEPVRMGPVHLWVDEEGLLKDEVGPFFRLGREGAWGPVISKRGILLMHSGGDDQWPEDFTLPLSKVEALVQFLPEGTTFQGLETKEGIVDHSAFGKMASINRVATFVLPDGTRIEQ